MQVIVSAKWFQHVAKNRSQDIQIYSVSVLYSNNGHRHLEDLKGLSHKLVLID